MNDSVVVHCLLFVTACVLFGAMSNWYPRRDDSYIPEPYHRQPNLIVLSEQSSFAHTGYGSEVSHRALGIRDQCAPQTTHTSFEREDEYAPNDFNPFPRA